MQISSKKNELYISQHASHLRFTTEAPGGAYVRRTMYDGGAWQRLCTTYDVRCTIAEFARVARDGGG